MKNSTVFFENIGVLTDNSYHVNRSYFQKKDKTYKAAKKVNLLSSRNPRERNFQFAMLFIFVFYNINNYLEKMKKNDFFIPYIGKIGDKRVLTCYLLSVNTPEN